MKILGRGKLHISVLADSGKYTYIYKMDNSMYVPSSPFSIILHQMIITDLNTKDNLDVDYPKHDDTEYIISFKKKHSRMPYCSRTTPIKGNGIFHLRTTPGYISLFAIDSTFQCYECYSGVHLIPDADEDSDI